MCESFKAAAVALQFGKASRPPKIADAQIGSNNEKASPALGVH